MQIKRIGAVTITVVINVAIAACNSSDNSVDEASILVNAGDDIAADERSDVTIQGSVSGISSPFEISWEQVSGPVIDLNDASTLSPNFRAPSTQNDDTVVMQLSVTNQEGQTFQDALTITINDRTSSSQGIDDNSDERRIGAESRRSNNRRMVDSREVRTYDGSNNNIENPLWGASFSQLQRWGQEAYGDGIASLAGQSRPSARSVSNTIAAQLDGETIENTFGSTDFLWQWGQFIDHDIGLTDGTEEAADIAVPRGDTYFDPRRTGRQVILFSRALYDPETGQSARDPRQQENEITAWIDGSMVYGSDEERALALRRSENSPYLATSNGDLLPFNSAGLTNANAFGVAAESLFIAGDIRANEQVGLASMHTLWVREHNRLAAIFEEQNPSDSPEEIYQAVRRLVIAQIQMITYNEYLPTLIGDDALSEYSGYKSDVNPGIFNEFSVAAYRYGHSLVNQQLMRIDSNGNTIAAGNLPLRDAFFTAPSILTDASSIEPILRGLAKQRSQLLDTKVIHDLRNMLFGEPGEGGLDLVSLNIQRGRDHGIPAYNAMRETLGLSRKNSFADITSNQALQSALAATYDSVDDIDLWVGGLAEDSLPEVSSQLGELFRHMHIQQFEALRDGDRFWYENDLTDEELAIIQGATLAGVIRNNTGISDEIQDNVFYLE